MENSELGIVGDLDGTSGLGRMGVIKRVDIIISILAELNAVLLLFRFSSDSRIPSKVKHTSVKLFKILGCLHLSP